MCTCKTFPPNPPFQVSRTPFVPLCPKSERSQIRSPAGYNHAIASYLWDVGWGMLNGVEWEQLGL
jgi:hypothetical protein